MESMNAIYDGNTIKFTEPIPVKGKYEVKVIFTRPLDIPDSQVIKEKSYKVLKGILAGCGDIDLDTERKNRILAK